MDRPKRAQLSRAKGWRMPPNTVKVDRTTKWGNPYRAGIHCDRYHAVDSHRHLCLFGRRSKGAPWPDRDEAEYVRIVRDEIGELRGKNLGCWCSLESPCHAETLLDLSNRPVCESIEGEKR
ncbi:DUF4326 domain-containing protein [Enterovirga rhinocerotis]|uniref:Uncharacterized protein DUF4326 n=1 Tax=Enterovirga rhinocerotis TaxID=1339210 RepID=A0A4R7BWL5_9HYPH|nr:DUF4326 domain-containing protein [Enterovirga rhinocerotis]TDR90264.1 uncharacterized protein DUF4326 [Enterovirga rhinocerotis]